MREGVSGGCAGLQGHSGFSTGSTGEHVLALIKRVLDGFSHHPLFFILGVNADPPVIPFSHQAELLFRLAFRKPVRILVGDEIGLGKTVEAILIAKMLETRDGAGRILILVPKILIEQWRAELKRFMIRPTVIKRGNIDSLASQGFPRGWYIASIDLVKRKEHRPKITSVDWDVVIVDEAHKVGRYRQAGMNQRYEAVEELAGARGRSLVLLSATPHRGHAEDYISRLRLVDPYIIGGRELDDDRFYRLTLGSIVMRRTKIDVNDVYEKKQIFRNAKIMAYVVGASNDEAMFSRMLFEFLHEKLRAYYRAIAEEPRALPLLMAIIAKRASSSPYAAMMTFARILRRRSAIISGEAAATPDMTELDREAEEIVEAYLGVGFEDYSEAEDEEVSEPDEPLNRFVEKASALLEERDIEYIKNLFEMAKKIVDRGDNRIATVINLVRERLEKGDRIVIFTEYADTAKYIYDRLRSEVRDIAGEIAFITYEEIVIPGWEGHRKPTIEDVKRLLAQGRIRVIVSTDVASEGLNLQAANIVINYEPTWSPIKIEQRLGRVWRLGQERDVVCYSVFLSTESDKATLENIYRKLLAWGRSLLETRSPVGEEIIINMMSGDSYTAIPLEIGGKTPRYSEYRAIISYIAGGSEGLKRYIDSIVNAIASLRQNLERVGLSRRDMIYRIDMLLTKVLGDLRVEASEKLFRDLFTLVARLRGLDVKIDGNMVFAGGFISDNMYKHYSYTAELLREADRYAGNLRYILSSADAEGVRELHLFRVKILYRGKPIYSETVGIAVKDSSQEVVRGRRLLELLVAALQPDKIISSIQEYHVSGDAMVEMKARAGDIAREVSINAIEDLKRYVEELEKLQLSGYHREWEPRDLSIYEPSTEYIGAVVFTSYTGHGGGAPPPIRVREVEKRAMEIAMEYERSMGREPRDVSEEEHFDIISVDPRSGEARYIEVKGRSGFDLDVVLTETEFSVAREKGERYWLYIVYGIASGRPRLITIRDPVRSLRWEVDTVRRYRFRA